MTGAHDQRVSRRGMLAGATSLAAAGANADAVPSAFAASPPQSIENDEDLERALPAPIPDNTDLDALAAACAEEGRWAFFVSVAPWRFKGATSSPVNPLAIF
jgi:hypothetical protein